MVETTTVNYGWTKPEVGASIDTWGGYINSDLDGIDTTVKGVSNVANAAYPASNPSGYQTAAQVTATLAPYALTASVPAASSTIPAMDGTAAVGAGTTWARADHVHPSDTSRLAISGGTMTGPIVLAADPVAAMQPATKQYVDGGRLGDNRIINGDMRIDQRNNGAGGTANGYTCDRWRYASTQAGKVNWQRVNPGVGVTGFPYNFAFTSNSAYASLTTDAFYFAQYIEADMISDFLWGTANAQPVTLSFWAQSSLTGTFSGSVTNAAGTRSYPFTYSISAANTWTRVVVTIPGDTAGTWLLSGNVASIYLNFDLGSGANFRGPAGAWAATNYLGVTGSVSIVATNAAQFFVTGVKLEVGSVATPFNRQSPAKSMADCQRYFQMISPAFVAGYGAAGGLVYNSFLLPVAMRAAPTSTFSGQAYTNASGLTGLGIVGPSSIGLGITATAAGSAQVQFLWLLSAEL